MGPDYPRRVDGKDTFVKGDIVVVLDEETGYVDYEREVVSVPRMGEQLKFKKTTEGTTRVEGQSVEYGKFYADIEDEVSGGYAIASAELNVTIYRDQDHNDAHPDIAVLKIEDKKQLALQLGQEVLILNATKCYTTHVKIILLCKTFFPPKAMVWDSEQLETIGSQLFLFMQININESIKKILTLICENRRLGFQLALAKSQTSSLPFNLGPGTLSVSRGEQVVIFSCALAIIRPSLIPQEHCYDELPVVVVTELGPKQMFLQPRTRILVQEPSPVSCSHNFPVRFYVDEEVSICQT